ncbi:hypothetical protein D3C72_2457300 [compost metagenome]
MESNVVAEAQIGSRNTEVAAVKRGRAEVSIKVFGLDGPIVVESIFNAAANNPPGLCLGLYRCDL